MIVEHENKHTVIFILITLVKILIPGLAIKPIITFICSINDGGLINYEGKNSHYRRGKPFT
ncbi:hypothetical protein ATN83_3287 [Raoultella ornithinolytica]|nr:hypothetical protein ATN83_3287 [Raoultella ornithinolytica]